MPKKKSSLKTGNKVTDQLYNAVIKYVEENGGSVVVIGGICLVQESPLKYNYGIMVRCTGKKPEFTSEQKPR